MRKLQILEIENSIFYIMRWELYDESVIIQIFNNSETLHYFIVVIVFMIEMNSIG